MRRALWKMLVALGVYLVGVTAFVQGSRLQNPPLGAPVGQTRNIGQLVRNDGALDRDARARRTSEAAIERSGEPASEAAPAPRGRGAAITRDNPATGTSEAPLLPPKVQTEAHGLFLPDDAALSHRLADLGIPYLMGSYSTNFDHATPSQADNIALAARKLNGQVVDPGQVFSYNAVVGPYTEAGGYGWGRMFVGTRIVPSIGGGVCQGASTLYNAVILSNLKIVERHQHGLTVPYLPPGQDATVTDSGGLDFRFRNDTDKPVLIRAATQNRWLTISIYGGKTPPAVTWRHQILETYKKTVAFTTDDQLPVGIRKTVAPGQDGARVRTWITIHHPDGPVTRDLGIDRYRASPQVIAVGPPG